MGLLLVVIVIGGEIRVGRHVGVGKLEMVGEILMVIVRREWEASGAGVNGLSIEDHIVSSCGFIFWLLSLTCVGQRKKELIRGWGRDGVHGDMVVLKELVGEFSEWSWG